MTTEFNDKPVACSGATWGQCAAPVIAEVAMMIDPVTLRPRCAVSPAPSDIGCPRCGGVAFTTRGLKKEEIARGRKVCSRCYMEV